jgi:hypothetical protein
MAIPYAKIGGIACGADGPPIRPRLPLLAWLAAPWGIGVLAGFGLLVQYSSAPGGFGTAAMTWPADTALPRGEQPALVMFMHPQCPCSRASLEELSRILVGTSSQVRVHVVFVRPKCFGSHWERTDLWRSAAAMPGVEVSVDVDGVEARRFGAATSGATFLYDGSGALVYRGGVTPSRGHVGDSIGAKVIAGFLSSGGGGQSTGPVFGCPLFGGEARAGEEAHRCHR